MNIMQQVSLADHSTMRLGGKAAYLAEVSTQDEVREAVEWAKSKNLPLLMIGVGSNIVWRDEGYNGLVLVNKIKGYTSFDEDDKNYYLKVGAGEIWDEVVARTVAANASGIEALSLIPGTTGATPVQNVGAYGQEISQTLVSIDAFDLKSQQFVSIPSSDCGFAYRTSRFKTIDRGRFLITSITLHLHKRSPEPPFYATLQRYLDEHGIQIFTTQVIRDAVIAIRSSKLPDPAKVANNGSFFANPIIEQADFTQLSAKYPDIVHWVQSDGHVKLSAAWLVEQAGFKGLHDDATGMATWPSQALVLVNERAHSTADLLKFEQQIVDAVQRKFGITLEQEPELLP